MDAPVSRLSLNGRSVRYQRARLVMFHGWRLVLAGAQMEDGGNPEDRQVELALDDGKYVGTVRTNFAPGDPAAVPTRGREAVLMGVGDLRRVR